MRRGRLLLVALLLAAGLPSLGGAAWDIAEADDPDGMAAFAAAHPREGLLWLREWSGLTVDTDRMLKPGPGGICGRRRRLTEYLIQSASRLEEAARVSTMDLPLVRLKSVRVTVTRQGRTWTYDRDDLVWQRATPIFDGVVYLDGTAAVGVIPDLRVGDRVRIVQEHELNGAFGLGSYDLGQRDAPCFQSGLEIRTPGDAELVAGVLGSADARDDLRTASSRDGRWTVATWVMQGGADGVLSACGGEYPTVRVTPHLKAVAKLDRPDVAVGVDWSAVGRAYLERIEGVFAVDEAMAAEVHSLTAGAESDRETIDRIYRHVQGTCHYLGLFEGMGSMIPVPARAVRDLGSGDCKGLATLIIAMLREAGVEAHPVVVRTRGIGPLDQAIPSLVQFDHFIVWADDGLGGLFLDGTTDFFPAGQLPDMDRAWPVLQLGPGEPRLVTIPDEACRPGSAVAMVTGTLALNEAGRPHLDVTYEYSVSDNLGTSWRSFLAGLSRSEQERAVLDFLLPGEPPLTGGGVEIVGMDAWTEPLVLRATARTRVPLPSASGRVFLPPALTAIAAFPPSVPACGNSVDLRGLPTRDIGWRLTMPEGFQLAAADSTRHEAGGLVIEEHLTQQGRDLVSRRSERYVAACADRAEALAMRELINQADKGRRGYLEIRY